MSHDLKVGQELWYVSGRSKNRGSVVVIEKVGRKWATISAHLRIDVETLVADGAGYSSPGKCWLSESEFEAEMVRNDAWDSVRRIFRDAYTVPKHLSTEQIKSIHALLQDPR